MAHIDIIVDSIGEVAQSCARIRIIPIDEANQVSFVENGVMGSQLVMGYNFAPLCQRRASRGIMIAPDGPGRLRQEIIR